MREGVWCSGMGLLRGSCDVAHPRRLHRRGHGEVGVDGPCRSKVP